MEPATAATATVRAVEAARVVAGLDDFDALVQAEQRRIYRVLLAMVRDPDAADSLTQECFLKAYRSRETFRGQCSMSTWLLRIAINLAHDHAKNRRLQFWRRLFQRPADAEDGDKEIIDPQPSPERALLAREELAAVWAAVARLPRQQHVVFILRFLEEMSIEEIAKATSLRPGTVKAHLFRAVGTVRESLKALRRRGGAEEIG